MNDLNTHSHSDAMVIDADIREEYQRLCEELDDGQPTEYEEWQDVFGGDDYDHGQFDGEEW